jgi:MFS transporter, DHA2 family, multidrug resistance protein
MSQMSISATGALAATRPEVRAAGGRWLVALSVSIGTVMGALDSSIVSVATPDMRGSLGATLEDMTWVTTGYLIAAVVVMPLAGFLGRMFGQKRAYLFALSLFLVGSALCAASRSLGTLVLFRALQGLGAGALQPLEQTILRQTFSSPREQSTATAIFGLAVAAGPAAGPTVGGLILEHSTWPWIFLINLPIGLVGMVLVARFVSEPADVVAYNRQQALQHRANLDWVGIALMVVGVASLEYVIEQGPSCDWFDSKLIFGAAMVAVVALSSFVLWERSAKVPAVAIHLFGNRVFCAATLIGGAMFAVMLAITFLLPVFLQELLGFTPTQAGLTVMPRALAMLITMPLVGRLTRFVSRRFIVAAGILLVVGSTYQMSHYDLDTSSGTVVSALIFSGIGFACLFVNLTTIAMSTVDRQRLADAAGLNSLARQIGGSLGLAILGTALPRSTEQARRALLAQLVDGRAQVLERLATLKLGLVAHGVDPASAPAGAAQQLMGTTMRQASVIGFEQMFFAAALVFLAVLPLVSLIPRQSATPGMPPGGRTGGHP